MQITKVITTVVATACAATAVPYGGGDGNNNGNVNCVQGDQVCCQSIGGLIGVGCVLNSLLLSPCTQSQLCCSNVGSGDQECTSNSGIVVNIPIHILGA